MMFGRILHRGEIYEGYFEVDGRKVVIDGYEIEDYRFLPPVKPTKIVCVGLNYVDHAEELNMEIPEEPIIFLKPPSAVIGHEDVIVMPKISRRVDYEGEIAVVIGKKCKNVKREEAMDYVLGYTCFNDVTARDLQSRDWQWIRAKSFDTFAPIGPYIVTEMPEKLKIKTRLNGRVVQKSDTSNLIFDIPTLIGFISNVMTLEKGDVIATGTPAGVGELNPGDRVEVEIENVGTLINYVVEEKDEGVGN